jgi:hypothetical protein
MVLYVMEIHICSTVRNFYVDVENIFLRHNAGEDNLEV